MDKTREVLTRVKNHVAAHKAAYAMAAITITVIALQQSNRKAFYAFLIEKGIDPMEFYCPEYFAEKQELKNQLIETVLKEHN